MSLLTALVWNSLSASWETAFWAPLSVDLPSPVLTSGLENTDAEIGLYKILDPARIRAGEAASLAQANILAGGRRPRGHDPASPLRLPLLRADGLSAAVRRRGGTGGGRPDAARRKRRERRQGYFMPTPLAAAGGANLATPPT